MKNMGEAVCLLLLLAVTANASAAEEVKSNEQNENVPKFNLEEILVEGDKDKFGNVITEQSYYRTGGDVNVVTRKEIEKRHFPDITSAIKKIPGVQVTSPGYRGGEYGTGSYYITNVSINGDSRVVVCLDGRRVDNAVSMMMSGSTQGIGGTAGLTNIDQVTSIDNIEAIEVIKGPGASIYGADATGGVINIITRKGTLKPSGNIDISTGSWGHHVYRGNFSGSSDDGSFRYFISAMRDMGGSTKYHDNMTGKDYRFSGTQFKDEGVNVRLDKYFDDTKRLIFSYNHTNAKDGNPIIATDWRYMSKDDWYRIFNDMKNSGKYGDFKNPGYRNYFNHYLGFNGSYTAHINNDMDLTYIFDKEHDMESFIRVYDQSHKYWANYGPNYDPWPMPWPGEQGWDEFIEANLVSKSDPMRNNDSNRGIQMQLGKAVGKHDILIGGTMDWSRHESFSTNYTTKKKSSVNVRQKTFDGFIQDKIHIGDKWEIAPALRYQHADANSKENDEGELSNRNSSFSMVTGAVNTQYSFDPSFSIFGGWTQVKRPLRAADYEAKSMLYQDQKLEEEQGNVWTLGLRKTFSKSTEGFVNFAYTNMSNAISRQSVRNEDLKKWQTKAVNAKQSRKAFNFGLGHKLGKFWKIRGSCSYIDETWTAKQGMQFQPGIMLTNDTINAYINTIRPKNRYVADLSYENEKWFSALTATMYTGMSTEYFTDNRFFVLDLGINYNASKSTTVYLQLNNLTNEGYEENVYPFMGKGAFPMPGRNFMIGVSQKF